MEITITKTQKIIALILSIIALCGVAPTVYCHFAKASEVAQLRQITTYGFAVEHRRRVLSQIFDIEQYLRDNPYNSDKAKWEKQLHLLKIELQQIDDEIDRITGKNKEG